MEQLFTSLENVVSAVGQSPWLAILILVGAVAFVLYRVVDLLQVAYVRRQPKPGDLERLSNEVYETKRIRKTQRTRRLFWKGGVAWIVQVGFIGMMPFIISVLQGYSVADGYIYMILMAASFLLNMLLSRLFPLWNPARPSACRAYQRERTWRPGNMAFHFWGVVSWAAPVYFLWEFFGRAGWIGSVVSIFLAQTIQLLIFVYTVKKAAIPYQRYPGLSDDFKRNLHAYLESQDFRDEEVGVLRGAKMGPNAFATGIAGYRQIVLTEELIQGLRDPMNPDFEFRLGEDTIEAVTSHEVGHLRYHHVEKGVVLGAAISSAVTIAVYYLFSGDPESYLVFQKGTSTQLMLYWGQSIFNAMLLYPLTFVMLHRARGNEWEADTHLLETNGCKNGQDFFHQIRHFAPVPNMPAWHRCNATHPPPKVREDRMKKWSDEHCV